MTFTLESPFTYFDVITITSHLPKKYHFFLNYPKILFLSHLLFLNWLLSKRKLKKKNQLASSFQPDYSIFLLCSTFMTPSSDLCQPLWLLPPSFTLCAPLALHPPSAPPSRILPLALRDFFLRPSPTSGTPSPWPPPSRHLHPPSESPKLCRMLCQAPGGNGAAKRGRVWDLSVESDWVAKSGLGRVGVCLVVDCSVLWVWVVVVFFFFDSLGLSC